MRTGVKEKEKKESINTCTNIKFSLFTPFEKVMPICHGGIT